MADNEVYLNCVKEKNKLRVRITSPCYNNNANCQFPRNIRVEGRKYSVPSSSIKVASMKNGSFFYRVSKPIKILDDINVPIMIYEEIECCICIANPCNMVIVECGHMCLCEECAKIFNDNKCPLCRGNVLAKIHKDQLT